MALGMSRKAEAPAPEREALAATIAELREHRERIAATELALSQAQEALYAARARHEAAEAAVETAKSASVEHLVAVAAGTAGKPPVTIREARHALTDAADDLDAARHSVAALAAELADRKPSIGILQRDVEKAAIAVLSTAPGIAKLVARIDEAQRALASDGAALAWLFSKNCIPQPGAGPGVTFRPADASPAEHTHRLLDHAPLTWQFPDLPRAAPWQAMLDALTQNAAAPITL